MPHPADSEAPGDIELATRDNGEDPSVATGSGLEGPETRPATPLPVMPPRTTTLPEWSGVLGSVIVSVYCLGLFFYTFDESLFFCNTGTGDEDTFACEGKVDDLCTGPFIDAEKFRNFTEVCDPISALDKQTHTNFKKCMEATCPDMGLSEKLEGAALLFSFFLFASLPIIYLRNREHLYPKIHSTCTHLGSTLNSARTFFTRQNTNEADGSAYTLMSHPTDEASSKTAN